MSGLALNEKAKFWKEALNVAKERGVNGCE
jgi:hypothetical protein